MKRPLTGMKVLELGQFESVPAASQLLAWMGSDVVKLERPGNGDPMRWIGNVGESGDSLKFWSHNGNKRSLALNLKSPAGRQIFLNILPSFDILLENLGPGAMERLDIGWDVLHDVDPSLIYGSITGFGPVGPHRHMKAFDHIAQAAGGSIALTGSPDGPPLKAAVTLADSGAASNLVAGVLAAYVERQCTGLGQRVDVSMQATVAAYLRSPLAERTPGTPLVRGEQNYSVFPCSPGGLNDYIAIFLAPGNERMWDAFLIAIDRTDLLGDPRFTSARALQDPDARREVAAWTRRRTKFEAWTHLAGHGVPCAPVQDSDDLFADPHLLATSTIQQLEHPERGLVQFVASPIQFDCHTPAIGPPPSLGRHTLEVLAESGIDFDEAMIRTLVSDGVLGITESENDEEVTVP